MNNVGSTYGGLGNHKQSLEFKKRSLAIREKCLGSDHSDTATSLNSIGYSYGELGILDQAFAFHIRALDIVEKCHGVEHPKTIKYLNNVVYVQFQRKRYGEAYTLLSRFLGRLPKNHTDYENLWMKMDNANRMAPKKGFRPPSVVQANKKKKDRKRK